ncbi:Naringenin-chalcone synthase [Alteripontixanthobacter maritimus]|uniref:Naringenin-chalcone synthase n=1 Tax=Alteripontixanthobacter maritimus TaxID=2161824 RepID=A0A369Q853_9SPHN|nr:type III polyketide synthase [Alteripontixanthobacter maritimus]RDC59457.1 Naringenin-chalcone synthase [Alteripontixanthobacter maritimus]
MTARITSIATAVPDIDFEQDYRGWAIRRLGEKREAKLYERMAARSGIEHRWSVLSEEDAKLDRGDGFYSADAPSTARRMTIYAEQAPKLALAAIAKLPELGEVTHIVVASCTGFVAPGIDQIIARRLGLSDAVERVLIGFMGCYAAVTALRTARHIVRSEPDARVLVVTVELSTLHHQGHVDIEPLLAGAQFGDGAAAAIVAASGEGLTLGEGISAALEESDELITWQIGDTGFHMHLSGEVPGRIAAALARPDITKRVTGGRQVAAHAVHAGGRSILDAVQNGLGLDPKALDHSRAVLREFGNMSSSTLMFVLERTLRDRPESGVALAFGPGLAMEGFHFGWTEGNP